MDLASRHPGVPILANQMPQYRSALNALCQRIETPRRIGALSVSRMRTMDGHGAVCWAAVP